MFQNFCVSRHRYNYNSFHLGVRDYSTGGLGTEVPWWGQGRSPGGGPEDEAEAVCRQCLQISTAETTTPSQGWGPRGSQGPSKNRQGPAKITGLFMLKNRKRPNGNPVLKLEQTAESHSLLSRLSRAPDRLVVALADHGCSQYTSIAAYDY